MADWGQAICFIGAAIQGLFVFGTGALLATGVYHRDHLDGMERIYLAICVVVAMLLAMLVYWIDETRYHAPAASRQPPRRGFEPIMPEPPGGDAPPGSADVEGAGHDAPKQA